MGFGFLSVDCSALRLVHDFKEPRAPAWGIFSGLCLIHVVVWHFDGVAFLPRECVKSWSCVIIEMSALKRAIYILNWRELCCCLGAHITIRHVQWSSSSIRALCSLSLKVAVPEPQGDDRNGSSELFRLADDLVQLQRHSCNFFYLELGLSLTF